MVDVITILREMRGETSEPLREELRRLFRKGHEEMRSLLIAQVESTLVVRGLTLFVQLGQNPKAYIYLSRLEIPGFIPISKCQTLAQFGWQILSDQFGQEFACVEKEIQSTDYEEIIQSIIHGLETHGAPQKHSWTLAGKYV